LMSMLVYRGFAVQNDSRVYLPGPSMGVGATRTRGSRELRSRVRPHLQNLRDRSGETAYFMVVTGPIVRFLLTSQAANPSRSGERDGFVLPAHASVGGRAILSTMTPDALRDLYRDPISDMESVDPDIARLYDHLQRVRLRG